jgi:hypothetical protein
MDIIELAELKGVELMYEGSVRPSNWGGKSLDINSDYLDSIVDATEKYVAVTNDTPSAKLDHGQEGTGAALEMLKTLSLGRVSKVWAEMREKNGKLVKVLLADFVGMPDRFLDMVRTGLASKRSVEIRRREGYGNVLDAVAFFGAGQPAVKALNDLALDIAAAEYGDADGTVIRLDFAEADKIEEPNNETEKREKMTEIETLQAEIAASKAELETTKAELEGLKGEKETADAEMKEASETIKTELDTVKVELAEYKQREIDAKMAGRESFVVGLVESKKLEPAKKDETIALCKSLEDPAYESLMKVLASLPVDSRFEEKAPSVDLGEYKGTDEEKATKWMKAKGLEDTEENYKIACSELGLR